MKYYLCAYILLLVGLHSSAIAQDGYTGGGYVNHNTNLINGDYSFVASKMDLSEIKGNALFWDDAMKGHVVFKNGKKTKDYLLNYDALNNLLVFNDGEAWLSVEPRTIDSVYLFHDDEQFVMRNRRTKEIDPVLMQLLSNGTYSVYKMKVGKYKRPTYNPALNTGNKFSEVKLKDVFVVCKNGRCFELPNSVKKIIKSKTLPSKLKKYAEQSGFKKLKKESQVLEFIEVVNQIADDSNTDN